MRRWIRLAAKLYPRRWRGRYDDVKPGWRELLDVTRGALIMRLANLEVLDEASFPESPIAPNRTIITSLGLAIGLLLGAITLRLARSTQPRPA